jgi:hypothetical protein
MSSQFRKETHQRRWGEEQMIAAMRTREASSLS